MILGLSSISLNGLWVLADAKARRLLDFEAWEDTESQGLSAQIGSRLENLLQRQHLRSNEIEKVFGVSGPGSFTGLRMGASFLQGFARACKVPFVPISTFDLCGKEFFIPIRAHKAHGLSLSEARAQNLEFLKLSGPATFCIDKPQDNDLVWGLADKPEWPEPADLLRGLQANLDSSAAFKIQYGTEPNIKVPRSPSQQAVKQ